MIKLKAPKEIQKAHRFRGMGTLDYQWDYRQKMILVAKAEDEDLNFVDVKEPVAIGTQLRLKKEGFTIFGDVIRWKENA